MTPEVFTAYTVLKPWRVRLGIIPCLLILPILTPLVVVLALLTYYKESRRADELCKVRMELVEGELPRFVATIHHSKSIPNFSMTYGSVSPDAKFSSC